MSDKKKNYLLSRRRRERFERLTLRFDLISAGLAAVIILATLVSAGRPYELGLPYAHGFALWFLLLLSYIPLEVVGLFNWVFGIQDNAFMRFLVQEHQALGMGLFNLGMVAAIWVLVRFWLGKRYGHLSADSAGVGMLSAALLRGGDHLGARRIFTAAPSSAAAGGTGKGDSGRPETVTEAVFCRPRRDGEFCRIDGLFRSFRSSRL